MLKFKLWKLAACLAVLVAGTGRGEAANYRLSDLLQPGAYFDSGDKRFSNFHNFTNPGDNPLDATNIWLTPISQPNRNLTDPTNFPLPPGQPDCGPVCDTEYGFRTSGPFDVAQNQNQTYGLDFTVTALGVCKIYAAEQELTGHATNATADLDTNMTSGPLTLAVLGTEVHNPGLNDTLSREYFTSNVTGSPICVTTAHVSMGWVLHADNVLGAEATINHFDTYFAQSGVPEPSTYALLLLGSAGVGLMVRRKQS